MCGAVPAGEGFLPRRILRRAVIGAELRTILETARHSSYRIDGFVVGSGATRNAGTLKFPTVFAKAKLSPWEKPLHTLRKSCIDDWAKVAAPNVVMEWATHSSLHTTMKYYSKVSPSDERLGQANLFRPAPADTTVVG